MTSNSVEREHADAAAYGRQEWNATARTLPSTRLVHELVEEQVDRTPDAIAVEADGVRWTYRELDRRACALARALQRRGVRPGDAVALCMERSAEMVLAIHATLKAGAAYAPVDPEWPAERRALVLTDLRAPVVLVTRTTRPLVTDHAGVLEVDGAESVEDAARLGVVPPPTSSAYVIFTSGSTGKPKGVVNTHAGILNRLAWMQAEYGLGAHDAVLQKTPYTFDVSVWELLWPLMAGARLVVARPGGHKDPSYLAGVIRTHRITTVHFVPSMLDAFLAGADLRTLPSLARVLCSGEALSPALARRFFAASDTCELHNLYGPTEAAIDVTSWACRRDDAREVLPIGRPIWNTQLYVMAPDMSPVPLGASGELCIGGVNVARGYLDRPELTAERFVPDPFAGVPGARMYRTGDLARWLSDGSVEYLGRIDHQVKLRGFRIELGEIEHVLARHPSVKDAVVVVREDAPGDSRLVAYMTARDGAPAPVQNELREHLRTSLPEYMIPAAYVVVERWPVTSNGKLDRASLPAPESTRSTTRDAAPPTTPIELKLAAIWCALLHTDSVGLDDNFFELGGHSLLLAQIVVRVQAELGVEVSLAALFDALTLREMAALVTERQVTPSLDAAALDALVAELEGLSPEEAEALLAGDA